MIGGVARILLERAICVKQAPKLAPIFFPFGHRPGRGKKREGREKRIIQPSYSNLALAFWSEVC